MKHFVYWLILLILVAASAIAQIQLIPNATSNIRTLAADPSAPADGSIWYNTTSNKFRCSQNSEIFDCTVVQDQMNRYLLRSWQGKMANLMRSASASATIAYIGDSWSAGDQITLPLRKTLHGTFGTTGIGYVGYTSIDSPPTGVTLTTGGSWTDKNGNADTTVLVKATATTTTLTLTSASAWGAADKLTWVCIGY